MGDIANREGRPISAEEARMMDRRIKVADLYRKGVRKKTQIARALGVATSTIDRDLLEVEKEYSEVGRALAGMRDMERMLAWERYMQAIEVAGDIMNDVEAHDEIRLKAVEKFTSAQDKINRLLGLNAPTKTALTDPTGEKEATGMSDALRMAILQERRVGEEIRRAHEENIVDAEIIEEDDSPSRTEGEEDDDEVVSTEATTEAAPADAGGFDTPTEVGGEDLGDTDGRDADG